MRGLQRRRDTGWVTWASTTTPAAFAVDIIRTWWTRWAGPPTQTCRLLMTADGGLERLPPGYGRPSSRPSPTRPADHHRLSPATRHLEVDKIEHRLISHISMNWRGRTLAGDEVIVDAIAATTTKTG